MAMQANLWLMGLPAGMMQVEIVLPSQHFGPRRMQAPEERLMIAVLQDALACLQNHRFAKDAYGRRLFDEAEQWFLAEETDWPYSFESICEILELDSNAVRQHLRVGLGQEVPVPGHGDRRPCARPSVSGARTSRFASAG